MKKPIIILITIFIDIISIFFNWYTNKVQSAKEITAFNSMFEQFTKKEITGVDVTTVLNKAIDNNEQYKISKKDNNIYENDGKYSIQICIKLEEEGNYYPMEALEQIGVLGFTKAYATALFKMTNIEYHENRKNFKNLF